MCLEGILSEQIQASLEIFAKLQLLVSVWLGYLLCLHSHFIVQKIFWKVRWVQILIQISWLLHLSWVAGEQKNWAISASAMLLHH